MAQTKKIEIRQAILDAAYELFSKRGYSDTNITEIARAAKVAPANLYVYFRSKLEILLSIYEPWLVKRFDELEKSLPRIASPRQRLLKILSTLWRDIPAVENGFANNWMRALATTAAREGYSPRLRLAIEERLAGLLDGCVPNLGRAGARELANIVLMAFDGYALNFHLNGGASCARRRLTLFADILLNGAPLAASRRPTKPSRRQASRRAVERAVAHVTG